MSECVFLIKRIFDFILALLILPVISPFLFLFAGLIKLDSAGPAFFIQKRLGRNGKVFNCFKFRTMCPGAEELLENSLEKDVLLKKEWESNFKLKKDPRVSRIGKFLRKTSLDELPQIFNVLRGEMSIVGPRPRPLYEMEGRQNDGAFLAGLSVLPGLTGLWQVCGRNELGFEHRIRLDASYVTNWSPWIDLWILIKTIYVVLWQKGAC